MFGVFASFALYDGQWPHPRHCHLRAPGPLNWTAYNSSPKFCPNDYISTDLLLSIAAWTRLEDQFCTSLPKEEHFVLPQCVTHYFLSTCTHARTRAHTCTQTCTPSFSFYLCHTFRHTLYSGSHVLVMFCQHLGSVSLCRGHAVISHYTDHPVIILFTHCWREGEQWGSGGGRLQHSLTRYVATVCLFLLSLCLSLSPVLPTNLSLIVSFS